ncbi:hypothetical protein FQN54_004082 [Arachnomyces sp. PD_36]|nr:hypothetical protein FQN54_004082 [Arachnomyces sp. PD_36]
MSLQSVQRHRDHRSMIHVVDDKVADFGDYLNLLWRQEWQKDLPRVTKKTDSDEPENAIEKTEIIDPDAVRAQFQNVDENGDIPVHLLCPSLFQKLLFKNDIPILNAHLIMPVLNDNHLSPKNLELLGHFQLLFLHISKPTSTFGRMDCLVNAQGRKRLVNHPLSESITPQTATTTSNISL